MYENNKKNKIIIVPSTFFLIIEEMRFWNFYINKKKSVNYEIVYNLENKTKFKLIKINHMKYYKFNKNNYLCLKIKK